MASITLRNVRKSFGETNVLHGVSLDVADGECVVFVGPSGCGKSTLLRLICGLEEVTSGTISIADEVVNDVPPSKRGIAMVFQSYALYPHMSVAENMGYALRLAGETREAIRARVEKAAAILRLDALLDRKPRQLSGGQRQRVAIGRAIVREPRVFLFDEPLSNLDAALRVDMRAEIAALKARLGTTMVYVTHDQIEAMTLADKIVVMNAGRIEQVGAPLELYHHPANLFVAGFIGSPRMNLLPLTRGAAGEAVLPGGASLPLPAPVPAGNLTLGIRPEHLTLAPAGSGLLKGTALVVEHLGSDAFTHINLDGMTDRLILRLDGTQEIAPGARVDLTFALADAHLFDANGMRLAASPAMGVAA